MAQIRETLILEDRFSGVISKYVQQMTQANVTARKVAEASRAVQDISRAQAAAMNAAAASARAESAALRLQEQQQRATATSSNALVNSIKSLAGAYFSLQGLRAVLNLSDTIASTTARLDMMNDGLQSTAELNNMIWESAQRSRGSYADTAAFVAKLGNLAGNAFNSNAEIIDFAEQINKQIVLSGASATEASSAVWQLQQALSSGVLRGEELNSVMEGTPMIAQTIANYMGVTTGEMRELASEGKVTAAVVKNAMLEAAEETNAKFEQMPMTWSQVWTSAQNIMIKTFQPVLEVVGKLANYIGDNLDTAIGLFYSLAGAVAFYTVAQWLASAAAKAFFTTLLMNPLTYIALVLGFIIFGIYQWVQSVGGAEIAWLKFVDGVLFAWDTVKAGFATGAYFVAGLVDKLILFFQKRVSVLNILQSMANGAIDIINWFIDKLNLIPGVSIDTIDHMTFATRAAAENEAAKARRNAAYDAAVEAANAEAARRQEVLANMWSDRDANHAARQEEIKKKLADKAAGKDNPALGGNGSTPYDELLKNTAGTKKNTASIAKAVDMTQEDIKSLVDVAERRYVNNINLTSKTPVINISGQNTGHTAADRQNLANAIRDILIEESASGAVRSTARPTAG